MDATESIRSIQQQEGNPQCFRTKKECKETRCAWRVYCLEKEPPEDYLEMLHHWMITEK